VWVWDAAGKKQKLYFFTSLDLPAQQILELYGYRWNIETDLSALGGGDRGGKILPASAGIRFGRYWRPRLRAEPRASAS
jgi:hypothetical protein